MGTSEVKLDSMWCNKASLLSENVAYFNNVVILQNTHQKLLKHLPDIYMGLAWECYGLVR